MLSGGKSLKFKPKIRSLSQFCALTCFVLTDCIVGLVEIEFLLLAIISVTSENSSGITIASGVDGNAVRKEVIGVQASGSVVEQVLCIHLLCTHRLRRWTCWNQIPPVDHNICNIRNSSGIAIASGVDGTVVRKEVIGAPA